MKHDVISRFTKSLTYPDTKSLNEYRSPEPMYIRSHDCRGLARGSILNISTEQLDNKFRTNTYLASDDSGYVTGQVLLFIL